MQAIYGIIDVNLIKHELGASQVAVAARVPISNTSFPVFFSFRLSCKGRFLGNRKVIFLYASWNM